MKKYVKLFAAALAALGLATGSVVAQEMKFFKIGTGGAGGTYFPIGGLIANAISSPPGARSCEKGGTCGVPGLVAIAVSTNAMTQDGILYNQINFSTTEENIWSAYIDVVINFANEKTPKKIRRFRRIIETRRITQLAEMINDIITILKKNT